VRGAPPAQQALPDALDPRAVRSRRAGDAAARQVDRQLADELAAGGEQDDRRGDGPQPARRGISVGIEKRDDLAGGGVEATVLVIVVCGGGRQREPRDGAPGGALEASAFGDAGVGDDELGVAEFAQPEPVPPLNVAVTDRRDVGPWSTSTTGTGRRVGEGRRRPQAECRSNVRRLASRDE
jgi:hypothetical protein